MHTYIQGEREKQREREEERSYMYLYYIYIISIFTNNIPRSKRARKLVALETQMKETFWSRMKMNLINNKLKEAEV